MLHCVTQYRPFHDVVCFQNVTLFRGTQVNVTVFASTRNVVHETEDHPVAVRAALVDVGSPTNDPPEIRKARAEIHLLCLAPDLLDVLLYLHSHKALHRPAVPHCRLIDGRTRWAGFCVLCHPSAGKTRVGSSGWFSNHSSQLHTAM